MVGIFCQGIEDLCFGTSNGDIKVPIQHPNSFHWRSVESCSSPSWWNSSVEETRRWCFRDRSLQWNETVGWCWRMIHLIHQPCKKKCGTWWHEHGASINSCQTSWCVQSFPDWAGPSSKPRGLLISARSGSSLFHTEKNYLVESKILNCWTL